MDDQPDQPDAEPAVECVIFDWAGTLTPWHVIDPAEAWVAAVGAGSAAERLQAAEAAIWIRCRDEHRSGSLAEVAAMAEVQVSPDQWDAYFAWWEEHTYTDPLVRPLFSALTKRGYKVGVLSNTIWPRDRHEDIFRRDGVLEHIDGAVYSSEIDWTKPHPEAFWAALRAVGGSDPARAVFVGDRLFDDIHGAKSAGMRAVLVPHSVIPAWQTTGVEGSPDAIIDNLGELLAHLDEWHRLRPGSPHDQSTTSRDENAHDEHLEADRLATHDRLP